MRPASPPIDVFILGTPFCGSTLLGNVLNAHDSVSFLGELNRLQGFRQFEGPLHRDGQSVTQCALCATHDHYDCPVWTPDLVARLGESSPAAAFRTLREKWGGTVLVDGSKNAAWMRTILDERGGADGVRVVHCVRSPLAFAASYKSHTGSPAWLGGAMWRDTVYDVIRTCAHYGGIPILTVQYEAFAAAPEPAARRVFDFLGLPYLPSALEYWRTPLHPLGGNYGAYVRYPSLVAERAPPEWQRSTRRYAGKAFGGWTDDRWLVELSHGEVTDVLFNPAIADAAALAGYHLTQELEAFAGRRPETLLAPPANDTGGPV